MRAGPAARWPPLALPDGEVGPGALDWIEPGASRPLERAIERVQVHVHTRARLAQILVTLGDILRSRDRQ